MKKTLLIPVLAAMLFAACSSEKKEAGTTDTAAPDTTMTAPSVQTTVLADTTAADSAAIDSATKAHGHAH